MKGAYKKIKDQGTFNMSTEATHMSPFYKRKLYLYKNLTFLKDYPDTEVDFTTKPASVPPTVYSETTDYEVKITKNIPQNNRTSESSTLIVKIDHDNKVVEYVEGDDSAMAEYTDKDIFEMSGGEEESVHRLEEEKVTFTSLSHDHNSLTLPSHTTEPQHHQLTVSEKIPLVSVSSPNKKTKLETVIKQEPVDSEIPTLSVSSVSDPLQSAMLAFLQTATIKKEEEDPDMNYFKSIMPFFKKMNEKNRRNFIRKTTNLCFEIMDDQDDEDMPLQPANKP